MPENLIFPSFILLFGAFVLGCETVVLARRDPERGLQGFGPQGVRIFGITIVIIVVAALTTWRPELASAAVTLLGTIAGYLVGRREDEVVRSPEEKGQN